jgi:hypothetical protein
MQKILFPALVHALLFAAPPARAGEFSDDAFCAASRQAESNLKAEGPKWVDDVTRNDGMTVDCDNKAVEFKKFLKVNAADMQHGWEDQMQQAMNQTYCQDPSMALAMDHGWSVNVSISMADGAKLPVSVTCGQQQ